MYDPMPRCHSDHPRSGISALAITCYNTSQASSHRPGPASHCPDPAQSLGRQLASYGLNVFIHLGSRISADLSSGLHLTSPEGQRSGTVPSNECVILAELSLAESSPGSSLIGPESLRHPYSDFLSPLIPAVRITASHLSDCLALI